MAFSMKLKPGKKTTKPAMQSATQPALAAFSSSEPKEVARKSSLPPPPLVAQSRPGVLSKAEKAAQEALESDPNVFDYDGMYDTMQAEKKQQKEAKKLHGVPQSKYIGALMEKAKIREIEHDRIRERRLLKERAEDDALHGDKEKFITASYKRKLMESKRWEEEDARLAAIEEANDVTKRKHGMAGFYANLLTNNIAMGGDESKAISAYTTGKLTTPPVKEDEQPPWPKKLRVESPKAKTPPLPAPKPEAEETPEDKPAPAPARSREDIIRAAKERYLARQQAAQGETNP